MVRDSLERGVEKELEIKEFLEKYCDIVKNARKNPDEYDIDLIVETKNNKIRFEIEETSSRNWPSDSKKATFSSNLLTMPLRKIKYFIKESGKIGDFLEERGTIKSFEDFYELYPDDHIFEPTNQDNYYIKGSYKMNYLSISNPTLIVNSLNYNLKDQSHVDKRVNNVKDWVDSWKINQNIWLNPSVKNMSGKSRSDPMLLILGHIQKDNEINWVEKTELCDFILGKVVE